MKILYFAIFCLIFTLFSVEIDGTNRSSNSTKTNQQNMLFLATDIIDQVKTHFVFEQFIGLKPYYKDYQHQQNQIGELANANLNTQSFGHLTIKKSGFELLAATFTSAEANALRLQLDVSNLDIDDKVWILDSESLFYFGPYTAKTNPDIFWGPLILGDTCLIIIESQNQTFGQFHILNYAHIVKSMAIDPALSCNLDINCQNSNIQEIGTGVARYTYIDGAPLMCTGTLIETQSGSGIPYFLTSAVCVNTSAAAQSIELYWDYRSTACNSETGVDLNNTSQVPRTSGSTLLVTQSDPDMTLLQLSDSGGSRWYAGWTTSLPLINDQVFGIHHPAGGFQRYSEGLLTNINCSHNCDGLPCTGNDQSIFNQQLKVAWSASLTEENSLGSPLYNSNGQIIGDETGCGPASCAADASGNWDTYASFGSSYDLVKNWLADASQALPSLRHTIPWVVNNSQWSSTIAIYNNGIASADITLRGLKTDGTEQTTTITIPAMTLYTVESSLLFPDMSGYALFVHSISTDLMPSFLTFNKDAASGASPSQSTSAKQSDLTNGIVFGYLNAQDGTFPALVIIAPGNMGSLTINMTLYDSDSGQIATDEITLTDERPYAAVLGAGLFDSISLPDHVTIRATTSSGKTITGATFYFNEEREPSMSAPFILP